MMKIIKAESENLEVVMSLLRKASSYLKSLGIDQWQNAYPDVKTVTMDIALGQSYLVSMDDRFVATFVLSFDEDPYYERIYQGSWLNEDAYAVVHRITVDSDYARQGIALFCMNEIEKMVGEKGVKSLRIDTHPDNLGMQKMILKQGFTYCGEVMVKDGLRFAYEKLIQ